MGETGIGLGRHSLEMERGALGAAILSPEARLTLLSRLDGEHFYKNEHRKLFMAIKTLEETGMAVDLPALLDYSLRYPDPEFPAPVRLVEFLENCLPVNIETYLGRIEADYQWRENAKTASKIGNILLSDNQFAAGQLPQLIEDLGNHRPKSQNYSTFHDIALKVWEEKSKKNRFFFHTGFPDLDFKVGGIPPSSHIVIGAFTGSGKTAAATSIALYGLERDWPVNYVSLDMKAERIIDLLICKKAGLDWERYRNDDLDDRHWKKINDAIAFFYGRKTEINCMAGATIEEIARQATAFFRKNGTGVLIVENIQQPVPTEGDSRREQVEHFSKVFHQICTATNCVGYACAQLSRSVAGRTDHEPQLADLRETGGLEQDADLVFFPHRPIVFDKKAGPTEAAFFVRKNRLNGWLGEIPMYFKPESVSFTSLETADRIPF